MEQENKLSETSVLRMKCFVEGFAAALSTQEILDNARQNELINMLTFQFALNTNESIDEETVRVICTKAYKERKNLVKFYIDICFRNENEETTFMQLIRDTVPGTDIVPLVKAGLYNLSKSPYPTEEDYHTIADKLIEVFPQHSFFLDRMRYDPYTKAKIGEFRISYDTHYKKVYNEEFVW